MSLWRSISSGVTKKKWRAGILFFSRYYEKNGHREWLWRMFCAIFLRTDELSSPIVLIYVQIIPKTSFISTCHKKDREQVFCTSRDNMWKYQKAKVYSDDGSNRLLKIFSRYHENICSVDFSNVQNDLLKKNTNGPICCVMHPPVL